MLEILMLAVGATGVLVGHLRTRRYVRSRLRFVDAVQHPAAPVLGGAGAVLVAAPVVWLLPVLGAGTALAFGVAVGLGVARGATDIRRITA